MQRNDKMRPEGVFAADFRSDTVTRPTKEMLEAMWSAPVGDDVFQEDVSVNALEEKAAEMFGMEAALFCPSGTMTNQVAIKLHTQAGDEVICDEKAHIYNYEGGGIAFNSGCSVSLQRGNLGRFSAEDVLRSIRPDDVHSPRTALVALENTVNKGGGVCWDFLEMKKIGKICRENKLAFHLDGARLFNALVAGNESAVDYGKLFDTISICLSKGLGAPVGSLLLGDRERIKKARRWRKVLGGGMRQAGYLAASGAYALDYHIGRLKEDHRKARILGEEVARLPFVKQVIAPETNILLFELEDKAVPRDFLERLKEKGVQAVSFGGQLIRMVTHLDISENALQYAIEQLKSMKA
ncbi:MAG: beta-eliminating lyase-related protein [Cytophagales bacterium]|nr:beta-eliminating lyase-related protein [Cytophagales bacterium]